MNILYLSYTGLLEPLGQSQVMAYLKLLSREHRITLVTFEKGADLDDTAAMEAQRRDCDAHGVRWLPKRYHHRPRLLATAWDLMIFTFVALRHAGRADVIHARAYIASFVALVVGGMRGKPFIFDMRAFWPEEMVAAGSLGERSIMYRLLKWAERRCLFGAGAVVSLTDAAVTHMRLALGDRAEQIRFAVVPTCVDLDRFAPSPRAALRRDAGTALGSVGTVLSGWFRLGWLAAFFSAVARADAEARFEIISRDDPGAVRAALAAAGVPMARVALLSAKPTEVPAAMAALDAVAMFFETGVAKLGSCPTRMGEVLACGLPVIANPGVGDVGEIVGRYRVGVLVEDAGDAAMERAAADLVILMRDPDLAARCRHAAEDRFSLQKGAATYDQLYREVTARR